MYVDSYHYRGEPGGPHRFPTISQARVWARANSKPLYLHDETDVDHDDETGRAIWGARAWDVTPEGDVYPL